MPVIYLPLLCVSRHQMCRFRRGCSGECIVRGRVPRSPFLFRVLATHKLVVFVVGCCVVIAMHSPAIAVFLFTALLRG